jgi:hypothetical protein
MRLSFHNEIELCLTMNQGKVCLYIESEIRAIPPHSLKTCVADTKQNKKVTIAVFFFFSRFFYGWICCKCVWGKYETVLSVLNIKVRNRMSRSRIVVVSKWCSSLLQSNGKNCFLQVDVFDSACLTEACSGSDAVISALGWLPGPQQVEYSYCACSDGSSQH